MDKFEPRIIKKLKNHPKDVRKEAAKIKQNILDNLFVDEAPRRELIEGVTIDKESSKDLDDGIWAEEKANKNGYYIYISIADVSEIIKPYSKLDMEAYARATSVYAKQYTYHMFPNEISTDLCSLNDQTTRNTITTRIELDKDFNIIGSSLQETKFKNIKRYNYQSFKEDYNNGNSELGKKLKLFHKIAKGLYSKRIGAGAQSNYRDNVTLKLFKESSQNTSIPSFVIQEFMIAANIENAKINFKEKINGIYRLHMPDLKGKFYGTKDIDRAFYNYRWGYHYGLGENFYGHFTSPIRRYSDLINHRQQKSWIRGEKEEYSINQIRNIIININNSIERIIEVEKKHNSLIDKKRIERFIKKLDINNFETISSVPGEKFTKLIKYFIKNPQYIEEENILNEILYRIENELLSFKDIARIKSSPSEIKELNILKKLIEIKENNKKQD